MSRAGGWLLLALAGTAACGGQGRDKPAAPDSTLFGDDRERQGDTARTVPEVALLERVVDLYESLDVAMDRLASPSGGNPVKHRAWKADRHEDDAKQRLLDVLQAQFGERYHPRTPDGAARTADSIAALPRAEGTRALNALVLDHHERVHAELGRALPAVANARLREVLLELQQHLADEIRKLKAGLGPSEAG
ncbi:MAG: hypothetical protein ACREOQ_10055 [Gemmatimonadales bacterium]